MHRSQHVKWPGWRNILIDGANKRSGVNLDIISPQCVIWRFLTNEVPNVDGNYTTENLTESAQSVSNLVANNQLENIIVTFDALNLELPESGEISPHRFTAYPEFRQ